MVSEKRQKLIEECTQLGCQEWGHFLADVCYSRANLPQGWRERIKVACPNCGEIVDIKESLLTWSGAEIICLIAGELSNVFCKSCETYFPVYLSGYFRFITP